MEHPASPGGWWRGLEGTGGDWRGCPVRDPCWEVAAAHRGVGGGSPKGTSRGCFAPLHPRRSRWLGCAGTAGENKAENKKKQLQTTAGTLSPAAAAGGPGRFTPCCRSQQPCGNHEEVFLTPKPPRLSARPPEITERGSKPPWFRPAAAHSGPLWVGGCLGSGEGNGVATAAPQNPSCPQSQHALGPKRVQNQHQKQHPGGLQQREPSAGPRHHITAPNGTSPRHSPGVHRAPGGERSCPDPTNAPVAGTGVQPPLRGTAASGGIAPRGQELGEPPSTGMGRG